MARFVAWFRRLAQSLTAHSEIGSPRSNGRRGYSVSDFRYSIAVYAPRVNGKRKIAT